MDRRAVRLCVCYSSATLRTTRRVVPTFMWSVLCLRALVFAVVAIGAGEVVGEHVGVFEGLAFGCEFGEFGTGALRENGVAGVAIAGGDFLAGFADGFVLVVVATETA